MNAREVRHSLLFELALGHVTDSEMLVKDYMVKLTGRLASQLLKPTSRGDPPVTT